MIVKEIEIEEFDNFASKHILANFYQTSYYGISMRKMGYKDMYIGIYDNNELVGASLILVKTISLNVKYGYAPRGFLIDYFNNFEETTSALKKFFNKKGFTFIKVNPLISYSEVNYTNKSKKYSEKVNTLIETLEKNNYKKLKDNLYFESMLPKYNAIVNLKDFDFNKLDYKLQNKINKINNKGLNFIKGDIYNISDVYEFIKRKEDASESFYNGVYKNFSEKNMIDLFLIEVNYHEYLSNLQNIHSIETLLNEKLNKIFQMNPKDKNLYIEKMKSDTKITNINKEISSINEKIQQGIFKEIIGGALVIKQNNIASIFISGFNKNYNKVLPNHFMHYMILTHYKALKYSYVDLNGITGDFSDDNPYKALNTFKLGWNPKVYEYIGEFDFIIKDTTYALLWSTKKLHKEFEKPNLKVK